MTYSKVKANVAMKKLKTSREIRVERPLRAKVSEKEAFKANERICQAKERFLATEQALGADSP